MGGPKEIIHLRPPITHQDAAAVLTVTTVAGPKSLIPSAAVVPLHHPGRMTYAETMHWLDEVIPFPPMPTYANENV
jgi:hypothetical protein